jgi:hypothetical protein
VRCEEFESRLNQILDRRRNPRSDAELSLHAASCPECGDLLAGYQALFAGFKRRDCVALPDAMPARVRLQLGQNRGRAAWRQRAPLALIAASLVVAAILPGLWNGVGRTPAASQEKSTPAATALSATALSATALTASGHAAHAPSGATPAGAPLTVLARMAGDQVRFLTVHSEQSAALAWRLVPSFEDVIEGIEGTAGPRRAPSGPGSNKADKPHNPTAAGSLPAASG